MTNGEILERQQGDSVMDRPYLEASIEDLEKIVKENVNNRTILAKIREELGFRTTRRAKQLRREVDAVLRGEVPRPPKPPRPDRPDDQLSLIG